MKKNMLLVVAICVCFIATAQKKQAGEATARCFTMERVRRYFEENPTAKSGLEQYTSKTKKSTLPRASTFRPTGINGAINIPVIFHVVLPDPYKVTDGVIQSQIAELNRDYAGINADSSNATNFYPVRGHSSIIRFVLARQTPNGGLSNGIDRVKSNTASNATLLTDPIKRSALGGADAWDVASYLNIWIGSDVSGKNILGYAQFPESGSALDDGVFCNARSFGVSSCNINVYNKGRTLCHEIGHYLGLFHIWGDENGCSGDDFRSLETAGSVTVLPADLFNTTEQANTTNDIGDTPNQGTSTSGCLTGIQADICTSPTTGKMYQNYMDYTYDNCYSMFTQKQVERMEWVLLNARGGLTTSSGGIAPTGINKRDAMPTETVNPGVETSGCSTIVNPSFLNCPGSIIPKVRILNNGSDSITSLKVGLLVNGVAKPSVTVTIPSPGLAFGATTIVTFPSLAVTTGNYVLKFYTFNVNGLAADQVPSNDTVTTALQVSNGVTLPASEDFEVLPFPAATWSLYNPDGDASWTRFSPGNNSAGAMFIDNFSKNNIGLKDELRTPKFLVSTTDSVIISFDLAHKNYPGTKDQLSVLVSNNCGTSWTTVYSKSGDNLSTAGSTTLRYSTPIASDWKAQKITIGGALLSTGNIIIAFQNKGDYGNNIFIDNILIYKQKKLDITASAILSPADPECSFTVASPQAEVSNNGVQAVTGFKVGYSLNNAAPVYQSFTQTILPGTSATVTLNPLTAAIGLNNIKVFTANPISASASGDENTLNDTISKKFTINAIVASPLAEDFEKKAFAPFNWQVINPDSAATWSRKSPGYKSGFSAFMDNFSNNLTGATDILQSPTINVTGADSVIISFDLAHKNYDGANDQLKVKVSRDCGSSFVTVFDKSGSGLATAGSSASAYINPVEDDWKTQRIVLDNSFATSNIIVAFENTSDYGNNIFIDNIHISALYKRNLAVTKINAPLAAACVTGPIAPDITVTNTGIDTITSFTLMYAVDNEAPVAKSVTGISLPAGQQMNVQQDAFTTTIGEHLFTAYCVNPVTSTGTGDYDHLDDTLKRTFVIIGTQPTLPVTESFESAIFPPVNWGIVNSNDTTRWIHTITAANSGNSAIVINNFKDSANKTESRLISPVIFNGNNNDSVFLSFALAYEQGANYPGSTLLPLDTLEVKLSTDCGTTSKTVWKKWGSDLQTTGDPNYPSFHAFVPTKTNWKNINCYLTPFAGSNNFQLYFIARGNKQNNIWLDDINIYAKQLPQKLKSQGYLIYPNPFDNSFLIHHFGAPVNLKAIQVLSSSGQLVYDKWYNGNANTEITVNLPGSAAGVYILKLVYNNKTVVQKIVKR
ncbi:choice-of-anchor J domain-containing protein [Ferruginibacter paludis]|uniref:T9SS-dependent choice-of-anchor J family protein n=1 Tax=Ferruginibacter paludis TaxID=1310417 RepID=UPI0025B60321|nr:choice-of-anchor J domain-containing protein [Ferruginibacter paludis]MDN3656247.1 choice-of-anchor J domain-containing protein [Ferruginibacter paludis]